MMPRSISQSLCQCQEAMDISIHLLHSALSPHKPGKTRRSQSLLQIFSPALSSPLLDNLVSILQLDPPNASECQWASVDPMLHSWQPATNMRAHYQDVWSVLVPTQKVGQHCDWLCRPANNTFVAKKPRAISVPLKCYLRTWQECTGFGTAQTA